MAVEETEQLNQHSEEINNMLEHRGYLIKQFKTTNLYVISTKGEGGSIPKELLGKWTNPKIATVNIDLYLDRVDETKSVFDEEKEAKAAEEAKAVERKALKEEVRKELAEEAKAAAPEEEPTKLAETKAKPKKVEEKEGA